MMTTATLQDSRKRPCSLERWATEFRAKALDALHYTAFKRFYRDSEELDPLVRFERALRVSSRPPRVPFGQLHIWYMHHRLHRSESCRRANP